jgi:hypothetical protein
MSPYANTNNTNATGAPIQIQTKQMRHQNKTNIEILYQNVGLELSERDEEKFENSKRDI